jgi:tetratricopeptide (TPR) repeat protein
VDQIDYLLRVKRNMKEADRVYEQFVKTNPGILAAYERVGDAYYNYGDKKGRARGVQEWTSALAFSGPQRQSIMGKLSQHYMSEGKRLFEYAANPDAPNDTLQSALGNFTKSLEYDQSNDTAAKLINETQMAITEREQRLKLAIQTVAAGDSVAKQAEAAMVGENNERALVLYRQAVVVFEQVSQEFKEQKDRARDSGDEARRMINRIINKVLDQAQDKLDEGDRLVTDNKFDNAIDVYNSVPTALTVVPDDAPGTQGQQKQKLIEESKSKIQDAEKAKRAWEEQEKQRKAQAEQKGKPGAGGAAPKPTRN